MKLEEKVKKILFIVLIAIICTIIFIYQTKKIGFHEDECYTLASSVNPTDGLMEVYEEGKEGPQWKSRDVVRNYVTLTPNNILNFKALYLNQAHDNHPPLFYTLVHFSSLLFAGQFNKYTVFVVNIIAFIASCFVIKEILKLLKKENLIWGVTIFYGLSMGTISMVIFQRMYMLLTFFIMLYFYYSIKIYKEDFNLTKKTSITLGIITVLGFLTQYYFAVYALFIFIFMIAAMLKNKQNGKAKKYFFLHVIYAVIGVAIFVPCINHLLFSDRGLKNLENSNYLEHLWTYIKNLAYSFTIDNNNTTLIVVILVIFVAGIIYWYKKSKTSEEKLIMLVTTIPSIVYFFLIVKMTSYQELRYIMPVIPFVVLTVFLVIDKLLSISNLKYKNIITTVIPAIIATTLIIPGFIFSKPKFLYENYNEIMEVAKENKDKLFVYVYDNTFNHMQSLPEMMEYKQTLIVNINQDELKYVYEDENLNQEDSYILSIKSYLDNDAIIEEIKSQSEFKNITELYKCPEGLDGSDIVENNLYLVSK